MQKLETASTSARKLVKLVVALVLVFAMAALLAGCSCSRNASNPSEEPPLTDKFSDVTSSDWFAEAVTYVSDKGIMNGYEDGSFHPYDGIMREDFATMLYRYANEPKLDDEKTVGLTMADVSIGAYYQTPAMWAVSEGIMMAPEGMFGTGKALTREEFAYSAYRYLAKNVTVDAAILDDYNDGAQVSPVAKDAMAWCVEKGIITGNNRYLHPLNPVSRAEAAMMMMRLDNLK